jgi:tetratricopeptide (TPR) repeat protein
MVALVDWPPILSRQPQPGAGAQLTRHFHQGIEHYESGQFEKAFEEFSAALRLQPNDAALLNNLGGTLAALGRFDEALRALDASLAARPDHPETLYNRGLAKANAGENEAALRDLERAVEFNQDSPAALRVLAALQSRVGRSADALRTLDRSLGLEPDKAAMTLRRTIVEQALWDLVHNGFATWSGGKPKGSKHPVKLTPGPPISDYIHEMRH